MVVSLILVLILRLLRISGESDYFKYCVLETGLITENQPECDREIENGGGSYDIYPQSCPSSVHVSWLDRPPFFYKKPNDKNQSDSIAGVFVDLIHTSLTVCCRRYGYSPPNVSFDQNPAESRSELHSNIYKNNATASYLMMAPVLTEFRSQYLQQLESAVVIHSPGEILILNKKTWNESNLQDAWRSLESVWLAIALSLLLSVLSGTAIWALDTLWNPEEFPNSFSKGTSEGFWWAFVTMTTVGYGDRTPKSFFGRLFGVVWIIFGISLCSVMTATITTAMTSINVNKDVNIINKNIAVLGGSSSMTEAVKHFAEPTVYQNISSMFEALRNKRVDGILLEKYTAIFALNHLKYSEDMLIGKMYRSLHSYGFAFWQGQNRKGNVAFPEKVQTCLQSIFMNREDEVNMVINRHLKMNHTNTNLRPKEMVALFTLKSKQFREIFMILAASCGGILVCAVLERLYSYFRRHTNEKGTQKKSTEKGMEA